jgi:hypothetical protein
MSTGTLAHVGRVEFSQLLEPCAPLGIRVEISGRRFIASASGPELSPVHRLV